MLYHFGDVAAWHPPLPPGPPLHALPISPQVARFDIATGEAASLQEPAGVQGPVTALAIGTPPFPPPPPPSPPASGSVAHRHPLPPWQYTSVFRERAELLPTPGSTFLL